LKFYGVRESYPDIAASIFSGVFLYQVTCGKQQSLEKSGGIQAIERRKRPCCQHTHIRAEVEVKAKVSVSKKLEKKQQHTCMNLGDHSVRYPLF